MLFFFFHSYTSATIVAFYLIRISTVPPVSSEVYVCVVYAMLFRSIYMQEIVISLDQAIANIDWVWH